MASNALVHTWESMSAYLADLDARGGSHPGDTNSPSHNWDMRLGYAKARALSETGDESLVAQASTMLEKVESIQASLPVYGWTRGVQGARVDVPAYLAGSPACFKRRVKRPKDVRHVRIYVNCACSAGITAEQMLRRGITVLGLVEALLAAQVHVELFVTDDGIVLGGPNDARLACHAVKLEEPLNLSVQGFVLAHPAFSRRVSFSMFAYQTGAQYHYGLSKRGDTKAIREAYGMAPSDVYVPWVQWHDPLIDNPDKWLEERISQLIGGTEQGQEG